MQCMHWLVKRHGSFLDPTTVSTCTKCAKVFCPIMLILLSSWAKLMSRRHSLLIIFRGWWRWYGSKFSQSSFNSIVLSVSFVKQCCFKICYSFCFYSASYTIFWFQKVFLFEWGCCFSHLDIPYWSWLHANLPLIHFKGNVCASNTIFFFSQAH